VTPLAGSGIDSRSWQFHPQSIYVYYCENETIDGCLSRDQQRIILVSVASHLFAMPARALPPGRSTLAGTEAKVVPGYASTQKNLGIAGLCLVIVAKRLLPPTGDAAIPTLLDYGVHAYPGANSLHNTPSVLAIYATNLVLRWTVSTFGSDLGKIAMWHERLAAHVYDVIDSSNGYILTRSYRPFGRR
jgi:phosphoserine aminotransferase